jgi:hypothetical protein
MIRSTSPYRRGAALLIVLATVILVATATATLARLASTARASQVFADNTIVADDLLRAAETPILAWLASTSTTVVLSPDSEFPRLEVLRDVWVVDDTNYELCLTAWDQCGLVPMGVARSGSPLRFGLPDDVRQALDGVTIPPGQLPGLDLLLGADRSDGLRVFPTAVSRKPSVESPAIGAFVGTHHSGRININTAPIELVEAALRRAGRGGLEQIVAARSEGRLASGTALPRVTEPGENAPRISATSTAWAFRIDIRVGPLRRSWWSVYAKEGSNRWECVQRLAIPE